MDNNLIITYDIETYPNIFTFYARHRATSKEWLFEISDRRCDWKALSDWCAQLGEANVHGVGYNNLAFDYPVVHWIINLPEPPTAQTIFNYAQAVINSMNSGNRFQYLVWDRDQVFKQIDLFKIKHFDNAAKMTSLKQIEFNRGAHDIRDLPYKVGQNLTLDQIDPLIVYNRHDVIETEMFLAECDGDLALRESLGEKYGKNFTNHNDTKIGEDIFIMKMEDAAPGSCYEYVNNRRQVRGTHRDSIRVCDIILPYVQFEHPEFNRILDWFRNQVIVETKGVFKDVSAVINGFSYDFGLGGIHGSIESRTVRSDDRYIIVDLDVTSFYPNLAIVNRLRPAHLPEIFCDVYNEIFLERKRHKKGSPENMALKLALNGAYGKSNSKFSPFYDPQFTMTITINGQLSLCMLAERMLKIPECEMIQVNTDGLTVRIPREHKPMLDMYWKEWESVTGLELEEAIYDAMFIRDVNNYLSLTTSGKLKNKGAYAWKSHRHDKYPDVQWHQNHSALVVPMAAEMQLVHGIPVEDFIRCHSEPLDFCIHAKAPRSNTIVSVRDGIETEMQNINRYYVSNDGVELVKIAPPAKGAKVGTWKRKAGVSDAEYDAVVREIWRGAPKWKEGTGWIIDGVQHDSRSLHPDTANGYYYMEDDGRRVVTDIDGVPWDERIHTKAKSKHTERRTSFAKGWKVTVCNTMDDFDGSKINYDYYIAEARKLVDPLL